MKEVQVQELDPEHDAQGRIAIDTHLVDSLDIDHGSGVLVTTSSGTRTALEADTKPLGRTGEPTVGIGRFVLSRLDVEQGDSVSVSPLQLAPATEATIVFHDLKGLTNTIRHALKNQLRGRTVLNGDFTPLVLTTTGQPASTDDTVCVANVSVPDQGRAFRITTQTELEIRNQPVDTENRSGRVETSGGLENVGGYRDELQELREVVEYSLTKREQFDHLGTRPPDSVLLYGPPGTGKTYMTQAVANDADVNFFVINGSSLVSSKPGESGQRLRTRFEEAALNSPSVLFIDEVDAIAPDRSGVAHHDGRLVSALLTELNGVEDHEEVAVIAATNRVDDLDTAVRRSGRFDREIRVGPPSEEERAEILRVHTRQAYHRTALGDGVDITELAARTEGFVGADLEALVSEAAVCAIREHDYNRSLVDSVPEHLGGRPLKIRQSDFEMALEKVDPSALREHGFQTSNTAWSDVGGLNEEIETLRRKVELPAVCPEAYEELDLSPSSGVILHGPPGTGKTLLARALAGELDANFLSVDGPELLERWVGSSSKNVREVFDRARATAPTVVVLDELDALGSDRDAAPSAEGHNNVVSQLLTELDGVQSCEDVYVIATTNRLDMIDDGLRRPGRFGTEIEVGTPDLGAREEILRIHTEEKPLGDSVSIPTVAEHTEGYTGAELEDLCDSAAVLALSDVTNDTEDVDNIRAAVSDVTISQVHFDLALEGI